MLNNTNPGFLPNGARAPGNALPPSNVPTIGDLLNTRNITWAYYGGAYADAKILADEAVAANPTNPSLSAAAAADPAHALGVAYCQIGKPDGILDGHPQSSKLDLFEAYVKNVLDALDANSDLKKTTAVFITWDEAGGYWD